MLERLRWWLIGRLLGPHGKLERGMFRYRVGSIMVISRPLTTKKLSHDAMRAFHCGDYSVLSYEKPEPWEFDA